MPQASGNNHSNGIKSHRHHKASPNLPWNLTENLHLEIILNNFRTLKESTDMCHSKWIKFKGERNLKPLSTHRSWLKPILMAIILKTDLIANFLSQLHLIRTLDNKIKILVSFRRFKSRIVQETSIEMRIIRSPTPSKKNIIIFVRKLLIIPKVSKDRFVLSLLMLSKIISLNCRNTYIRGRYSQQKIHIPWNSKNTTSIGQDKTIHNINIIRT